MADTSLHNAIDRLALVMGMNARDRFAVVNEAIRRLVSDDEVQDVRRLGRVIGTNHKDMNERDIARVEPTRGHGLHITARRATTMDARITARSSMRASLCCRNTSAPQSLLRRSSMANQPLPVETMCAACEACEYAISERPEEDVACIECGGTSDCDSDCRCETIRRSK